MCFSDKHFMGGKFLSSLCTSLDYFLSLSEEVS